MIEFKNYIYSIFIISILILLVLVISNSNLYFLNYVSLILSICFAFTHFYFANNFDSKIKISPKELMNKVHLEYFKPLQNNIKDGLNSGKYKLKTFFGITGNNDLYGGWTPFAKNKYKTTIVVGDNLDNSLPDTVNTQIENAENGIQILINNLISNTPDYSNEPFIKKFCSKITKSFNSITDDSFNYNNLFGNQSQNFKTIYNELESPDLIILSQNKVFAPLKTLDINQMILPSFDHTKPLFNVLALDTKFNFNQVISNCKTINTNNIIPNNIYLEGITTNNLQNLNNIVDVKWFHKINNYISKLNNKQIFTVFAYTYKGDGIANSFLRNNNNFESDDLDNTELFDTFTNNIYWTDSYFPFYFQLVDFIKKTDINDFKLYFNNLKYDDMPFMNMISFYENLKALNTFKAECRQIFSKNSNLIDIIKIIQNENRHSINYMLISALCFANTFNIKFWKNIISDFISDLNTIILNAPPTTNFFITYRGTKKNYLKKNSPDLSFKDNTLYKHGVLYQDSSFISTTIDIQNSESFINYVDNCCLQRILIPPDTRCLPISGLSRFGDNEKEILLPINSLMFLSKNIQKVPIYLSNVNNNFDNISNICPLDKLKIKTNDLVLIGTGINKVH